MYSSRQRSKDPRHDTDQSSVEKKTLKLAKQLCLASFVGNEDRLPDGFAQDANGTFFRKASELLNIIRSLPSIQRELRELKVEYEIVLAELNDAREALTTAPTKHSEEIRTLQQRLIRDAKSNVYDKGHSSTYSILRDIASRYNNESAPSLESVKSQFDLMITEIISALDDRKQQLFEDLADARREIEAFETQCRHLEQSLQSKVNTKEKEIEACEIHLTIALDTLEEKKNTIFHAIRQLKILLKEVNPKFLPFAQIILANCMSRAVLQSDEYMSGAAPRNNWLIESICYLESALQSGVGLTDNIMKLAREKLDLLTPIHNKLYSNLLYDQPETSLYDLPDEIVLMIMHMLDRRSLAHFMHAGRRYWDIALDDKLPLKAFIKIKADKEAKQNAEIAWKRARDEESEKLQFKHDLIDFIVGGCIAGCICIVAPVLCVCCGVPAAIYLLGVIAAGIYELIQDDTNLISITNGGSHAWSKMNTTLTHASCYNSLNYDRKVVRCPREVYPNGSIIVSLLKSYNKGSVWAWSFSYESSHALLQYQLMGFNSSQFNFTLTYPDPSANFGVKFSSVHVDATSHQLYTGDNDEYRFLYSIKPKTSAPSKLISVLSDPEADLLPDAETDSATTTTYSSICSPLLWTFAYSIFSMAGDKALNKAGLSENQRFWVAQTTKVALLLMTGDWRAPAASLATSASLKGASKVLQRVGLNQYSVSNNTADSVGTVVGLGLRCVTGTSALDLGLSIAASSLGLFAAKLAIKGAKATSEKVFGKSSDLSLPVYVK